MSLLDLNLGLGAPQLQRSCLLLHPIEGLKQRFQWVRQVLELVEELLDEVTAEVLGRHELLLK